MRCDPQRERAEPQQDGARLLDVLLTRPLVRRVHWQVKDGDASAAPEAVRQYTEGLTLLQEAIDSGNYNEKVCESLNKKAKGVHRRTRTRMMT